MLLGFVFSILTTSEGVRLLWSLFNPHILGEALRLIFPLRDDTGHVRDLRGGRGPKDKPGVKKLGLSPRLHSIDYRVSVSPSEKYDCSTSQPWDPRQL